jgi:hypothetical protein
MADHWHSILKSEPFWLDHDYIMQLTNKEMYIWHLQLNLARQQHLRREQANDPDRLVLDPQTAEEVAGAIATLQSSFGG